MISIIVIVKNDRGIENTLTSLKAIDKKDSVEIIVIDASGDKLNNIKIKFPTVKWIKYNKNPKKPITIPEQRNMGIKTARGNIIVFIDANCIPRKNWLLNLTQPIVDEEENLVSGKTLSQNRKSPHDLFYEAHERTKVSTQYRQYLI